MDRTQLAHLEPYQALCNSVKEVYARICQKDWNVAVQKMRTALQYMVGCLTSKYGINDRATLDEQIKALCGARLITDDSAQNYYLIKQKGNMASHENTSFSEEEACSLYDTLLWETLVFAEVYMKSYDPDGGQRLSHALSAPVTQRRYSRYPKWYVRLMSVLLLMYFSALLFAMVSGSEESFNLCKVMFGLTMFIMILIKLITGDSFD